MLSFTDLRYYELHSKDIKLNLKWLILLTLYQKQTKTTTKKPQKQFSLASLSKHVDIHTLNWNFLWCRMSSTAAWTDSITVLTQHIPYWNKHPLQNVLGKILHRLRGSNPNTTSGVIPEHKRTQNLSWCHFMYHSVMLLCIHWNLLQRRGKGVEIPAFNSS